MSDVVIRGQYKWTVDGLSVHDPNYICFRWMEISPDYELLKCIGSVYGIQTLSCNMYAADSLRCFYALHDLLSSSDQPEDMVLSSECYTLSCGCKRLRDACGVAAQEKRTRM